MLRFDVRCQKKTLWLRIQHSRNESNIGKLQKERYSPRIQEKVETYIMGG